MTGLSGDEQRRISDSGRGAFLDLLAEHIAESSHQQADLGLLCIRMFDLVRIQHTRGYRFGDLVLEEMYRRLSEIARDQDFLTWIGDGKFVLLLTKVMGEGHAILAANKIQRSLSAPFGPNDNEISVRLAVGIALLSAQPGDAESLLRQAEIALMAAEENHQNYRVFSVGEGNRREREWSMGEDIERVIENGELDLVFQPKVELVTGEPVGFEAMIQWNHPERGVVDPHEVWDLGQRSGCLPVLTWWALQNLLRAAHSWPEVWDGLPLSLRIPKAVAQDRDLVPQISSAVNFWGMAPDCLGLDLDEDLASELAEESPAVLANLRDMGVHVAVAGFGASNSCLVNLAGASVSELKIDRRIVAGMLEREEGLWLVDGIIRLGHSLRLKVSAQGVDDADMLERLRQLGCDYAQGAQIAPAMDEQDLVAWLAKSRAANS